MNGQMVVVKALGDIALLRRLWEVDGRLVFIHDDEQWDNHKAGRWHLEAVGFPLEDVFAYDEIAKATIRPNEKPDWSKLTPLAAS